ncbi:MAG: hypothetical protein SPG48_10265 [Treponema sp.]|nr:hypothetical protein [Treponema sp.]
MTTEKRYTVDIIVKTDVVEHQVLRMNDSAKHGGIKRVRTRKGKVLALIEQLACLLKFRLQIMPQKEQSRI